MDFWHRLPEPLRWALLPFAILAASAFCGISLQLLWFARGEGGSLVEAVALAIVVAGVTFHMAFSLAPRRPAVVGRFVLGIAIAWCGASLVLALTRAAGIAGWISALPPPSGESFTRADLIGIVSATTWLVAAPIAYRINATRRPARAPVALTSVVAAPEAAP